MDLPPVHRIGDGTGVARSTGKLLDHDRPSQLAQAIHHASEFFFDPLSNLRWSRAFPGTALFDGDKDAPAAEASNQVLTESQPVVHTRSAD